mgnify:CR=1 FL=1
MTRLFYSAGAARIVVIQQNSLTVPKSMGCHMGVNVMSANHVAHGSDVIKTQTAHSAESPIKNSVR